MSCSFLNQHAQNLYTQPPSYQVTSLEAMCHIPHSSHRRPQGFTQLCSHLQSSPPRPGKTLMCKIGSVPPQKQLTCLLHNTSPVQKYKKAALINVFVTTLAPTAACGMKEAAHNDRTSLTSKQAAPFLLSFTTRCFSSLKLYHHLSPLPSITFLSSW